MVSNTMNKSSWSVYLLLCLCHTLMHVFTQMHIALIPILRTELSLDTLTIGLIAAIPLLTQGVFTIPGGLIADRVNRLQLIAVGLLISGVTGILMSGANNVLQLMVFASMFHISSTLLHPPALSVVGGLVPPNIGGKDLGRGKLLGFFGSAGTLGIALGPITLAFLVGTVGWRAVYLMWSIPAIIIPALILRLKLGKTHTSEENHPKKKISTEFHVFRNIGIVLVLTQMGVRSMGGQAISTYISSYFVDRLMIEPSFAILLFGMNPLMGVFASSIGGVMVDKFGEKIWLFLGFISQIISLSLVAFIPDITLTIIGYLSYAFFGIMEMPAEQSLLTNLTDRGSLGFVFSLSFLPGSIVGSFGPILVALLINASDIWYIFPYAIAMYFVCIFIIGLLWKRTNQISQHS